MPSTEHLLASSGAKSGVAPTTVCYPLSGDSIGGSHHSLRGLVEDIDPARFRILIVPEVPDGKIAAFFAGFEQIPDPARPESSFIPNEKFNPAKFASTFAGLPQRVAMLREQGVDIVHTNDGRSHATWALAARLAGAPLLWHHRGDPGAMGLRFLAPILASRVLTVSKFSLPTGGIFSAAHKAEVVFSPFDTSLTADRVAARRQIIVAAALPENALILGYFGSFIDRKRPLLFVDAVKELRRHQARPVYGLMFGEAEQPEMAQSLQTHIHRSGMGQTIRLMGYRTPGHEWIAGCDVLIVPATGEPLGRTLVEAMLVRTPVVATRSGGNPEALANDTGCLVDPESPEALASGVLKLLADPIETNRMIDRAEQSARERFSKKRHVASVTRVYEELTQCRPTRRVRTGTSLTG
ncbi:glycosyltransferase family 4 protein [Parerythrobacter aurantius]|uniref:glycosyltransferase family 4 protein n=1 Tax=Parerythrobacter aurantius TaxID=3127706 RepID=UPI0032498094